MLYYWYRIIRILLSRKFLAPIDIDSTIERKFRVRLFDCDGLRVMTASKYPVYMDFVRWETIARSELYNIIVKGGLAPTLGSQKIIYRRPLKIFSTFQLKLELAGWDDKWIYHIHTFTQHDRVAAIGITRALIWKRDTPVPIGDILQKAGASQLNNPPPSWITELFEHDKSIINQEFYEQAG